MQYVYESGISHPPRCAIRAVTSENLWLGPLRQSAEKLIAGTIILLVTTQIYGRGASVGKLC